MTRYASTFIVGLKDFIETFLNEMLPTVKIHLLLDGLVVYQTSMNLRELKRLRCFNNTFLVLRMYKDLPADPVHALLERILKDKAIEKTIFSNLKPREYGQTFRLIASNENQLVSIDSVLRNRVENKISNIRQLRLNRSKPNIEFWFVYRNEGFGFFLKRITFHTAYEKTLEKGELKPELSYILCSMSRPHENDIFLDPFSGFGSIPIERALSFPYNMIFAVDKDSNKIKFIKNKIKNSRIKKNFIVKYQNALELKSFEGNFIHKIVTDPPWGIFEKVDIDINKFYFLMLKEFNRVLRKEGMMVILTARKEEFENVLTNFKKTLKLINKFDILVSGKKAAIYQIIKVF